jgi:hypothetical protein
MAGPVLSPEIDQMALSLAKYKEGKDEKQVIYGLTSFKNVFTAT